MKLIPVLLSTTLWVAPVAIPMAQAQSKDTVQFFPALAGVNFTEAQISQLEQLRLQTRRQVETVVTPQQRQRFFNALQANQGLRAAIASADLSGSQRTQVRNILRGARQQAAQILTVSQRRQILNNFRSQWLGQS